MRVYVQKHIETAQISLKRTVSYHHQKRLLGYFRILIFHSFVRNGFVLLTFFGNSPAFNEKHFTNAEEFPITVAFSPFRWSMNLENFLFAISKILLFQRKLFSINCVFCFRFRFFWPDANGIQWNEDREISHITLARKHTTNTHNVSQSKVALHFLIYKQSHSLTMDFQMRVILLIFNA